LVDPARFGAMFGVYGLAEAVNLLMDRDGREGARYGHDAAANELAYRIVERVADVVAARPVPHVVGERCFLHSQSGIDLDEGVTAGTRIPVGTEPVLYEHLRAVAPHHRLFTAGVSDIVHVDATATRNPQAVVDIIKGSFREGMRDFTFNLEGNGFIRITGYLVRASDIANIAEGARHASAFLGAGAEATTHVTARRVQRVVSHESAPRPAR
jgi:YjjI family glycine radical enzyme